jgi:hypothetical protein
MDVGSVVMLVGLGLIVALAIGIGFWQAIASRRAGGVQIIKHHWRDNSEHESDDGDESGD